jgi:phenylpropionate dioxygenase-like ring-hydroxylating dioxygenase large terminal subunit
MILFAAALWILVATAYSPLFRHWTCIGIRSQIDFSKPYKTNIGELPLVVWENPVNGALTTALNICKHMGSRLDVGKITPMGCLKCPYHGLEFSHEDRFGETVEHEGKVFWAYNPVKPTPYSVPFFRNRAYEKSFLKIDMDCSLTDSAYNTMDFRHPEFVHNKVVGFGNVIPPSNVKHWVYDLAKDRVGLSFDYASNRIMRTINDNVRSTRNYHMYMYPTFSWSKVSFEKKHLMIGVHLQPLGPKKTRWYITLCHNYYDSTLGKEFMKALAMTILNQDYMQMRDQAAESALKREVLFEHVFKDEEPILHLKRWFADYQYPDIDQCVELYKDFRGKMA